MTSLVIVVVCIVVAAWRDRVRAARIRQLEIQLADARFERDFMLRLDRTPAGRQALANAGERTDG
jgi:hypothetical protein